MILFAGTRLFAFSPAFQMWTSAFVSFRYHFSPFLIVVCFFRGHFHRCLLGMFHLCFVFFVSSQRCQKKRENLQIKNLDWLNKTWMLDCGFVIQNMLCCAAWQCRTRDKMKWYLNEMSKLTKGHRCEWNEYTIKVIALRRFVCEYAFQMDATKFVLLETIFRTCRP